jgi:ketosteroid isomerase-like protein
MSQTITPTADEQAVRAGFEALATGDLAAFEASFHEDATWNHRNDDPLGGVHTGRDAILEFVAESGRLTNGTLRVVPSVVMSDGHGHVAVTVRVSADRPDGRTFDDAQILLFTLEDERVRAVEQYIGDHDSVTAFWS